MHSRNGPWSSKVDLTLRLERFESRLLFLSFIDNDVMQTGGMCEREMRSDLLCLVKYIILYFTT